MTKKLLGVCILTACILALALPVWASTDAAATSTEAAVATSGPGADPVEPPASAAAPARVEPPAAECPGSASSFIAPEVATLLTPTPVPVCEFCNLTGFANCESTDGTACYSPGTHKRCYINPPCACEWGICICGSGGTWACYW
jgi:hypothetical protein